MRLFLRPTCHFQSPAKAPNADPSRIRKKETLDELNAILRDLMNQVKVVLSMKGKPWRATLWVSRKTSAFKLVQEKNTEFSHFDILTDESMRQGEWFLSFPKISTASGPDLRYSRTKGSEWSVNDWLWGERWSGISSGVGGQRRTSLVVDLLVKRRSGDFFIIKKANLPHCLSTALANVNASTFYLISIDMCQSFFGFLN